MTTDSYTAILSCGHFVRIFDPRPEVGEAVHCAAHCDARPPGLSYPIVQHPPNRYSLDQAQRVGPWSWIRERGLDNSQLLTACQHCWKRAAVANLPSYPMDAVIPVCRRCAIKSELGDAWRHFKRAVGLALSRAQTGKSG